MLKRSLILPGLFHTLCQVIQNMNKYESGGTMTLAELVKRIGCEIMTGNVNLDKDIKDGYVSDLLSDVIGNIKEKLYLDNHSEAHQHPWRSKTERGCVPFSYPATSRLRITVIAKAREEGVAILRDPRSAFELLRLNIQSSAERLKVSVNLLV
ncbi:MAG: hypothetical protein MZV70_58250 [Desulfobacterales bacterium]|nr:hypothetical protein [Desulfobacterales bacterium]